MSPVNSLPPPSGPPLAPVGAPPGQPVVPHSGRKKVSTVAAVAILVAGGLGVYTVATSGDESEGVVTNDRIPTTIKEQWSVDLDGSGSPRLVGSSVFVVTSYVDDDEVVLHSLNASDGEERWNVELRDALNGRVVGSSGSDVLIQWYDSEFDTYLTRLSSADGEEKWEVKLGDKYVVEVAGEFFIASSDGDDSSGSFFSELRSIDLSSGRLGSRVQADRGLRPVGNTLIGVDSGSVQLYDLPSLNPRGKEISIDDDVTVLTLVGGLLITAEDDTLKGVRADGAIAWTSDSTVGFLYTLEPAGDKLLIGGEDGTALISVNGNGIEEVWDHDGFVVGAFPAAGVAVLYDHEDMLVVRLDDGTSLESIDAEFQSDGTPWTIYSNGLTVEQYDDDFEHWTVEAFVLPSTDAVWELEDAFPIINSGRVISVAFDDSEMTITLYG